MPTSDGERARSPPSRCATCSGSPTRRAQRRLFAACSKAMARRCSRRRRPVCARGRAARADARADGPDPPHHRRAGRRRGATRHRPRSARRSKTGPRGCRAGALHRLWQLLLKGHDEVRAAPDPLVAAQMALLRVLHAADLPDPGTLAKKLEETGRARSPPQRPPRPPSAPAAPAPRRCGRLGRAGRAGRAMRGHLRIAAR